MDGVMQVRGTDLEVHGDGWTGPLLLIICGQQLNLSTDLRLLHASHALDPDTQGRWSGTH